MVVLVFVFEIRENKIILALRGLSTTDNQQTQTTIKGPELILTP